MNGPLDKEKQDEDLLSIYVEYDESITNAEIEWILRIADYSLQHALWDSIFEFPEGVDQELLEKINEHKYKKRQVASRYFSPLSPFSLNVKQISTEKSIYFIYDVNEILELLNQIWIQYGPTIPVLTPFFLERMWEYLTNKRYRFGPRPSKVVTKKRIKEEKSLIIEIEIKTKFLKGKYKFDISKNKSIQKNKEKFKS